MASFEATAYGPPWNAMEGGGTTSTGVVLDHQKPVIAVDPNVIPYGSIVKIPHNPFNDPNMLFVAADTGGAIKGNRIDFFVNSGRSQQNGWGRQNTDVQVVQRGSGPGSVNAALSKVLSDPNMKAAAQAAAGVTPAPSAAPQTTSTTTGGQIDWSALGLASLLQDAGRGINMSGKFTPHDVLGSMLAKAASGAYTTPTVVTNTVKQPSAPNAAPSSNSVPQAGGSFAGTFPKGVNAAVKRHDMGRDAQGPAGTPLLANGSGHVVSIGNNPGGFGIAYPIIHYDTGPWAGLDIYYGHTKAAVSAGQRINPGDVVTHTQDGSGPYVGNATGLPGWVEIGLASNFGKGYGGSNPGPLPPGL